MGIVRVTIVSVSDLPSKGPLRKPDPYVKVEIDGVEDEWKTDSKKNETSAEFNETHDFEVEEPETKELEVKVKDEDRLGDSDTLGKIKFSLANLWENNEVVVSTKLDDSEEAAIVFKVLAIGWGKKGTATVRVVRAESLRAVEGEGTDAYVVLRTPENRVHRTNVVRGTTSPEWGQAYGEITVPHPTSHVTLEVYHHRTEAADDLLGRATVDFSSCQEGQEEVRAVALEEGEGTLVISLLAENFSG